MCILCVHMSCVNMASLEKTNSWREWVRPAGRWDHVELLTVHTRRVSRAWRDRDNVELAERFDSRETCLERNIERNLKRTRENSLNLIEVTAHTARCGVFVESKRKVGSERLFQWAVAGRQLNIRGQFVCINPRGLRYVCVWVTHNIRPLA